MTASSTVAGKRIVVIGAGPCGLGAALRLTDMGYTHWTIIDSMPPGGLSRSVVDPKGFTWDVGGHVIFSHYAYFDDAMDLATNEWFYHQRESWVRCCDTWVPYPFQNNIHRLPPAARDKALQGLVEAHDAPPRKPTNFEEYFTIQMGEGIADLFMRPYNFKVWAVPPKMMSTEWTGERVATVDLQRVRQNIKNNTDDLGWGPNALFRFPQHGGTGGVWTALANKLPQEHFVVGSGVRCVDMDAKTVTLENGKVIPYDALISTMALDDLLRIVQTKQIDVSKWPSLADRFIYSTTHVIGLGMKGSAPPHLKTTCWMYFPDKAAPFYRATVFSNYSKFNAPEGCWSLMLEVSESRFKDVNESTLVEDCVAGCLASDLLKTTDEIVSKFHFKVQKGYPTPFIGRNELLSQVLPALQSMQVYSRGRFGGWKYEVANQDHSMMQGVECVEEILTIGHEVTYHQPSVVNAGPKDMTRRLGLLKPRPNEITEGH